MRWLVLLLLCGVVVLVHVAGAAFSAPRGSLAAVLWTIDIALWAGMGILALLRFKRAEG